MAAVTNNIQADKHAGKHLASSYKFGNKPLSPKNKRSFIEMTKQSAATFYPQIAKIYNTILNQIISAYKNQGNKEALFRYSNVVGADNGHETDCVQIYFSDETNSCHIRPIYVAPNKSKKK